MKPGARIAWATLGGLLGGSVAYAGLLAWRAARLGIVGQEYTAEVAKRAAEGYLGEVYGLTPERIRRLSAYGTILGA
jgi:hypothetical protein